MKIAYLLSFVSSIILLTSIQSYSQDIQPTDDEQYMLELINRARMNPAEEGLILANHPDPNIQGAINFFGIDKDAMIQEFSTYPPRPPLAMNVLLIQAARRHSTDLRDNNFQSHTGTDGSTLGSRIDDTGYLWRALAENVFSYGRNLDYSHAGFLVDWGVPSLGHRNNTLEFNGDPIYTEVGVGIVKTTAESSSKTDVNLSSVDVPQSPGVDPFQSTNVGPLVVTIDFATSFNNDPKVLGVVYEDHDNDNFYSLGEGKGEITVSVVETGASTVTFLSGGYAIEIPTPGTYTIEIEGNGIAATQKNVEISQDNVKIDFIVTEAANVHHWMMY